MIQKLFFILPGKLRNRPFGADAGGDQRENAIDDSLEFISNIFEDQTGPDEANASIDVVAYTSRGDHSVLSADSGHPANRKTVAPMDIRHRQ
jgi:hypothetical protein